MSLRRLWNWRTILALLWAGVIEAQSPVTPPARSSPAEETSVVSGAVVRKVDGAPVKGATVQLRTGEDRDRTIAAKSGLDGRFELKNIPAGQYHLTVSRNGYAAASYGQKKPGDPGAIFSLRPGQHMSDLLFKLSLSGVITGRVFDEDGEPMAKVMVMAVRSVYRKGQKEFEPSTQSESNDLGEFRLYGLDPGRYYVSAEVPTWGHVVGDREFSDDEGKNSGEKGFTKVFYPNATDPGKATSFVVKEGEEIPAIDILMKEITVYRIRGKVLNQVAKHGTRQAHVEVFRRNQRNDWFTIGTHNLLKADGSFEIPEVPPGEYTVLAMLFDEGKMYSTRQDVEVTSADIDGLLLAIGPGASIPGRITWEGQPALSKEELSVYLNPEQNRFGFGGFGRVEENGTFTLKEVPEGEYEVVVSGISKDCYIKEVRLGEAVAPDTRLRVGRGAGNLELTLSSEGARVDGTVLTEENLPAAGVWAVVVPEESKRRYLHLYKSGLTDQYGHFEIHGLAPGKYKLFSWEGIESDVWEDPDFLKDYEGKGESLEVQDNDKKTVELKLIPEKVGASKTD